MKYIVGLVMIYIAWYIGSSINNIPLSELTLNDIGSVLFGIGLFYFASNIMFDND